LFCNKNQAKVNPKTNNDNNESSAQAEESVVGRKHGSERRTGKKAEGLLPVPIPNIRYGTNLAHKKNRVCGLKKLLFLQKAVQKYRSILG